MKNLLLSILFINFLGCGGPNPSSSLKETNNETEEKKYPNLADSRWSSTIINRTYLPIKSYRDEYSLLFGTGSSHGYNNVSFLSVNLSRIDAACTSISLSSNDLAVRVKYVGSPQSDRLRTNIYSVEGLRGEPTRIDRMWISASGSREHDGETCYIWINKFTGAWP